MKDDLRNGLNKQLELEFGAAHHYLAMSIWFDLNGLPGFSAWMRRQSQEELLHAHRIIQHLVGRDVGAVLPAVSQPPAAWESAEAAVAEVLASEQRVTAAIEHLYDVAEKTSDRAAVIMLQWFINEQIEEESLVRAVLDRLKLAGSSGVGLLMVDQEMAKGAVPGADASPNPAV